MDTGTNGEYIVIEHSIQVAVGDDELLAGSQLVVAIGVLGLFQIVSTVVQTVNTVCPS